MDWPKISILLTSYSDKQQLARAMEYVYSQEYAGRKEVIVVDNGSTDNSAFLVTSRYPQVKLIRNDVNLGLGHALNQAYRSSTGDLILTVHQDVELDPMYLSYLVPELMANEKVGSANGLIVYRRARGARRMIDSMGIGFRKGLPIRFGEGLPYDPEGQNLIRHVFGASGAAALYKREALEAVAVNDEVFDGDFFARFEDHDLALRLRLKGYSCVFNSKAIALHKRGVLRENRLLDQRIDDMLRVVNPLLIAYKCFPYDSFKEYAVPVKRYYRRSIGYLVKQHGPMILGQVLRQHRGNKKKMLVKQNLFFADRNLDMSIFRREVLGA